MPSLRPLIIAALLLAACAQPQPRHDDAPRTHAEAAASRPAEAAAADRFAADERPPADAPAGDVRADDGPPAGPAPAPAAPRAGDASAGPPLTVAVISDLNAGYGSTTYGEEVHQAVAWLRQEVRPDLVLSTGDMVAGQRSGLDYEAMWAGFHRAVTTPLTRAAIPLAVTPGNHDASAGGAYLDERQRYIAQWQARRPDVDFVDDSFYPLYYAFRQAGVLFVSLDTTLTGPIDTEQRAWLDQMLSRHGPAARAIVAFGHVPLYPFAEGREHEALVDVDLERLLVRHRVDLVLSGHHHAYYPGRRDGLRLVSMACLGSGPRALLGQTQPGARGVALLRFGADGAVDVQAYEPATGRRIDRATLPERVGHGAHTIWRDDVGR